MSEKNSGRNVLDVAMELTNIELKNIGHPNNLHEIFAKNYALVKQLENEMPSNLEDMLPASYKENLVK